MNDTCKKDTINVGILGAGRIARKFAQDIKYVKDAKLYAVGARTLEGAREFANEFNVANCYGSYEELVKDENVDIIYISTPNSFHKEHTLLCLNHKKAVICEKPFASNAKEVQEMIDVARKNNVFLMEAMWTRFFPTIKKVREWIEEGKIGEVHLVQGDFGFKEEDKKDIRFSKAFAGGAVMDVGIYPISFASMIYKKEPKEIFARAKIGETGIDEIVSVMLDYGNNKIAHADAAIVLETPRNMQITGDKGYICIPNIWAHAREAFVYSNDRVLIDKYEDKTEGIGYQFELEEAIRCLKENKTESSIMPLSESLDIMNTLDRIRQQIGL